VKNVDAITLDPIEHQTMTEAVTDRLLTLISSGQLGPGDMLPPERDLAEQLQIGRTTVREALKHLTLVGILEAKRGSGTYVSSNFRNHLARQLDWSLFLSASQVEELFEIRHALEILAAQLAAQRATPEELEKIAVYQQLLPIEERDVNRETEIDLAFHEAIAQASHNELLVSLMSSVRSLLRRYMAQSISMTESMESTYQEHDAVYQAIQAHDPARTTRAMTAHLDISYRLARLVRAPENGHH
jgi:GntR family transcriptional regulator, transcriptional repressor for pyruvate dehydrogenase complex